jgi:hypothetical protein
MRRIILSIITFLLISCNSGSLENKDKQKDTIENKEEQITSNENKDISIDKKVQKDSLEELKSFIAFCKKFGEALKKNDTTSLDKYIDSVVIFHGYLDFDPVITLIGEERIILVMHESYKHYFRDAENEIVCKDVFLNDKVIIKEYVTNKKNKDYQWICNFKFIKNESGEWKLVETYTDTRQIVEFGIKKMLEEEKYLY